MQSLNSDWIKAADADNTYAIKACGWVPPNLVALQISLKPLLQNIHKFVNFIVYNQLKDKDKKC